MKDKVVAYGFVGIAAVLLLFAIYKTFLAPKTTVNPLMNRQSETNSVPTEVLLPPTLSPQEREIVAKIETKAVEITDTAIVPATLTVKQYDQIQFFNKTKSKTITVDGTTWGKIPLGVGENMTQGFKEVGTFKYQVTPLGLNGEVIVK